MSTRTRSRLNIYRDKDPARLAVYSLAEAAHYLRLPLATVRSWAVGRPYPTAAGKATFAPVIALADPHGRQLSFFNLVELHVLASLRREHRVQLKAVQKAIGYLRQKFDTEHPLIDQQTLTDGKDLFIERYGEYLNLSASGQLEMKVVLEGYLKRIQWDDRGLPSSLFPVTRPEVDAAPEFIVIDPKIRFGRPCLAGTGIPTRIIAERHGAGDSIALLMEDYGRSQEEIEEALRYESRVAS